jgi:uncharacterized protein (UPF0335 family)
MEQAEEPGPVAGENDPAAFLDRIESLTRERDGLRAELQGILEELDGIRRLLPV